MSRVLVICEGQTEAAFVRDCLQPYLLDKGVYVFVENMRGNVSSQRVAHFVRNNFRSFDKITTLLDFYGFQDREQDSRQALEAFIAMTAQGIMPQADIAEKFLPYVQMYEFEGLLFSDVSQFEWVQDGWNTDTERQLQAIRNAVDNPELINDSPLTAPSKRLGAIFTHHYKKVEHGSIIAESIGLQTIREQCPNFNEWLMWLESLGN